MAIITTVQAAAILGVHQSTVNGLCRKGELQAQKVDKQWQIDEAQCREYALTYDSSHLPKRPNRAAINKPVGKGWKTSYTKKQVWASVDEQIKAAQAGKIKVKYMTPLNELIKYVKCGEVIK